MIDHDGFRCDPHPAEVIGIAGKPQGGVPSRHLGAARRIKPGLVQAEGDPRLDVLVDDAHVVRVGRLGPVRRRQTAALGTDVAVAESRFTVGATGACLHTESAGVEDRVPAIHAERGVGVGGQPRRQRVGQALTFRVRHRPPLRRSHLSRVRARGQPDDHSTPPVGVAVVELADQRVHGVNDPVPVGVAELVPPRWPAAGRRQARPAEHVDHQRRTAVRDEVRRIRVVEPRRGGDGHRGAVQRRAILAGLESLRRRCDPRRRAADRQRVDPAGQNHTQNGHTQHDRRETCQHSDSLDCAGDADGRDLRHCRLRPIA